MYYYCCCCFFIFIFLLTISLGSARPKRKSFWEERAKKKWNCKIIFEKYPISMNIKKKKTEGHLSSRSVLLSPLSLSWWAIQWTLKQAKRPTTRKWWHEAFHFKWLPFFVVVTNLLRSFLLFVYYHCLNVLIKLMLVLI